MTLPCVSNPDMWFSTDPARIDRARQICSTCPLAPQCADAGKGEEYGVWGGVAMEDRTAERRQARSDRAEAVRQLRTEGHTVRAIAAQVGLSKSAVSKMLTAA